eukprot:UN31128
MKNITFSAASSVDDSTIAIIDEVELKTGVVVKVLNIETSIFEKDEFVRILTSKNTNRIDGDKYFTKELKDVMLKKVRNETTLRKCYNLALEDKDSVHPLLKKTLDNSIEISQGTSPTTQKIQRNRSIKKIFFIYLEFNTVNLLQIMKR